MSTDYVLLDPTGNITVLAETPVPIEEQPACAAELMKREPSAEQVGFVSFGGERCDLTLRMAGGEFCGNAAMSAGALWCERMGCSDALLRASVSGCAEPVELHVQKMEDAWLCGITMPGAVSVSAVTLPFGNGERSLPAVDMGGILHIILRERMEKSEAEEWIRVWCRQLRAPALGLMLLEETAMALTPLVYVPGADTLCWEHSCASGTAAAGCYLARERGEQIAVDFTEPGGILQVTAHPDGRSRLQGRVRILKYGTME